MTYGKRMTSFRGRSGRMSGTEISPLAGVSLALIPSALFASSLPGRRRHPSEQRLELVDEIAQVLEAAVDRGEANVGDLVQLLQLLHDPGADLDRVHLAHLAGVELPLDFVADRRQRA